MESAKETAAARRRDGRGRAYERALTLRKRLHRRVHAPAWRALCAAGRMGSEAGGYRLPLGALGLAAAAQAEVERRLAQEPVVVLADVDQDGYYLSRVGPLPGLPQVAPDAFLPRPRNQIELVASHGGVGVRKHYGRDADAFVRELRALRRLGRAGCHVPALLDADARALTLTASLVPGSVLREALAERGARLRDREAGAPSGSAEAREAAWASRVAQGRRVLGEVVDAGFVERLRADLKRAHAAGVILNDIKYGNVVIEARSGQPYWIDFDRADVFLWRGHPLFRYLAARDRQRFAMHFGASAPGDAHDGA